MIIVKIMGGFASQLQKYLFGYRLAIFLNTELALDLTDYTEGYFRKYCLEEVNLPIVKKFYTKQNLHGIKGKITVRNSKEMLSCLKSKLKVLHIVGEEKDYVEFLESYPNLKIMPDDEWLTQLKLKKESTFLSAFRNKIKTETSISVHIRRGDFAVLGWADSLDYFKGAVCKLFNEIDDSTFYFFSNDIEWCKEEFGYNNRFSYISSLNVMAGDIEELFCMSYCDIRILSKLSGYGILANKLGVSHRVGSYAVLDGTGIKKNNLQPLIYKGDGNKNYSEKGIVCYLEAEEYIPWAKKFMHIFVEDNNEKKEFLNENNFDIYGIQRKNISAQEFNKLLEKRYKSTQYKCGFTERLRILEKIQLLSGSQLNLYNEWRKLYNISSEAYGTIVILCHQKTDCWKRNPMQRMGIILSRVGYKVLFIDMFNLNKKKSILTVKRKFQNMKDMDGGEYNVLSIAKDELVNIQDIQDKIYSVACKKNRNVIFVTDFLNPFAENLDKQIQISGMMDIRSLIRLLFQSNGYPLLLGFRLYRKSKKIKFNYNLDNIFDSKNCQILEEIEKYDISFVRNIINYTMLEVGDGQ